MASPVRRSQLTGMRSCGFQISSGKSSVRRPECSQFTISRRCAKPRIIHAHSPIVYKIEPEKFLSLVQKLTGRPTESLASRLKSHVDSSSKSSTSAENQYEWEDNGAKVQSVDSPLATPLSTHLLESLPSPRLVTLNFLPTLFNSPRNESTTSSGRGQAPLFPQFHVEN